MKAGQKDVSRNVEVGVPGTWSNQALVLFHGTNTSAAASIQKIGVSLSFATPGTDFGVGFYTTTNSREAEEFARHRAILDGGEPWIGKFIIERNVLSSLKDLWFVRGDARAVDYWSFVDSCRRRGAEHGRSNLYDVVIGPLAYRLEQRIYPDYDQVSFHTPRAIDCLNSADAVFVEIA